VLYEQQRPSKKAVLLCSAIAVAVSIACTAIGARHLSWAALATIAALWALLAVYVAARTARELSRDHSFPSAIRAYLGGAPSTPLPPRTPPSPLTDLEMRLLRYFADITYLLPKSDRDQTWGMQGTSPARASTPVVTGGTRW
jgi:hypothetical protein